MELCDITLKEAIRKIGDELNQTSGVDIVGAYLYTQLFGEIVEGINYLHSQIEPIMHRDIKLSNILLSLNQISANFIKISDFGCAKKFENVSNPYDEKFDLMEYHTKAGTKRYMAPEVINGDKYDISADIYSLGIILCDFFRIDEKKLSDNDYILKLTTEFPHYSRIITLVKKLLHNWISMRPKCEGILRDRHIWEIGFEEIQSYDILQNMSHQNWNSYFYGRRDCVNLSTLIVMKKVQFEVEKNFKSAISKEINNRLTLEYSGIRDINRADVINMNSNMFQLFRNDLEIFLPLILHSLNINYSLEQLNLFLENKLEDNFSSKWQCFSSVAPIASFPKIINWYNCKYFFIFFYSSVIQKSFIQVMLINTINIKCDSNDSEVYFLIKSSMTKEMTEKSVTLSLNEINKNLSIEELQKSICTQMNQLYNNLQWHCYIAKSELFLAYYDMFNHKPDTEQMNAFRIKDYCIIIASSPFTATPFKNIKLTHRKIWKNISADEELILKSSISPNIGFFQSIHLKKVTSLNNQNYFVRITHKPTDLF